MPACPWATCASTSLMGVHWLIRLDDRAFGAFGCESVHVHVQRGIAVPSFVLARNTLSSPTKEPSLSRRSFIMTSP